MRSHLMRVQHCRFRTEGVSAICHRCRQIGQNQMNCVFRWGWNTQALTFKPS